MQPVVVVSESPEVTRAIARGVAPLLRGGDVVVLAGDLGAGKTTFVQGAADGLGVRAAVQSPSFVLVREYAGALGVTHADVYRLNDIQELIDLGYEELFAGDRVAFIEWGDAVEGELPDDRLEVTITADAQQRRRIEIGGRGSSWEARSEDLAAALTGWAARA